MGKRLNETIARCRQIRLPSLGAAGLLLMPILLSFAIPVAARTYYVDCNDPSANDEGPGTSEEPFFHIEIANYAVETGDSVVVREGTYHESIHPYGGGGEPGAWITYRSEIPHGAILDGRTPLEVAAAEGYDWEEAPGSEGNIWFHKLVRPYYLEAWRDEGRMPSPVSYYPGHPQYGYFQEGYSEARSDTMFVWLADGDHPDDFSWEISINKGARLDDYDGTARRYVRIENFVFRRFGINGISVTEDRAVITGNLVEWNGRSGIGVARCGQDTVIVSGNEAAYNSGGIGFSQGIAVYRPNGRKVIIEGNICHHTFDGGPCGTDGKGFNLDTGGPNGGGTFVNNVSYENTGAGFSVYQSSNAILINNTSFNNCARDSGAWFGSECVITGRDSLGCDDVLLRNNIFAVRPGPQRRALRMSFTEEMPPVDLRLDHNLYFQYPDADSLDLLVHVTWEPAGGDPLNFDLNLAELRSFHLDHPDLNLDPLGVGAIYGSPLLIDYGNGHYRVESNSPAVDSANPLWAPDFDIDGNMRPYNGLYDMGAWEYYVGAAAPPAAVNRMRLRNCPNPFNPATRIRFSLADPAEVTLAIYDPTGRRVRVLIAGTMLTTGEQEIAWNGRDLRGRDLPSGVYFASLSLDGWRETRELTLLR